ncbi:hypothetical protein [Anaerotruncus sp. DFI.9.16]|uniref:hypothetical protein n=1 Tax=Anaerotruncus sp. DFI.9.16 TaxID=2965275 RepID=UPI00210C8758|nr:hypothetical protein [Anaerotruncus sp. DFI.9.16]MCQ4895377.1 hypothetical protein [Anaerotruncus sp. DFI.9.16]
MKWNLGIALALAWALLLPVPAFAVDTPSNSDYLFVDGYTVHEAFCQVLFRVIDAT